MKITDHNADEVEVHRWVTEASDLGLAPGDAFPEQLPTDLGNGLPFLFVRRNASANSFIYEQANGCLTLTVFND